MTSLMLTEKNVKHFKNVIRDTVRRIIFKKYI